MRSTLMALTARATMVWFSGSDGGWLARFFIVWRPLALGSVWISAAASFTSAAASSSTQRDRALGIQTDCEQF